MLGSASRSALCESRRAGSVAPGRRGRLRPPEQRPHQHEVARQPPAAALAEQIGPDWAVTVQRSALVLKDGALGLRATELEIHQSEERSFCARPTRCSRSIPCRCSPPASMRSIELRDLQLRASVNPDGSLSFLPATRAGPERAGALADAAAAGELASQSAAGTASVRPSSLSAALSSLFRADCRSRPYRPGDRHGAGHQRG